MSAPAPARRSRPRGPVLRGQISRQWPITVILLMLAGGLLTVQLHHFRAGAYVMALALLGAAALRLLLSPRAAGLLVVRSRLLDVALTGALGFTVLVLAYLIPVPN